MPAMAQASELWRERLHLPTYGVAEAARYARTSPQTVSRWERIRGNRGGAVSARAHGAALSYLQLIELGVVAAMRNAGLQLSTIKEARAYLAAAFDSKYPFAEYRFMTDGKELFVSGDQFMKLSDRDKLLSVNRGGQLAWTEILAERLAEFEYSGDHGPVASWRVAGADSPVRIDPRIAFGAPQVRGVATSVLRGRWVAGESLQDIAGDYDLPTEDVIAALEFEDVDIDRSRPSLWIN